jgi:hypothetical protein
MVQHFMPAVVTQENERIMGMKMSRLDKFGAFNDRWTHGERRDSRPAWQIIQSIAKVLGARWDYHWTEDIFEEMAKRIPSFKGMSYEQLDSYHGVELGRGDRPVPHGWTYIPHEYRPQLLSTEKVYSPGGDVGESSRDAPGISLRRQGPGPALARRRQ